MQEQASFLPSFQHNSFLFTSIFTLSYFYIIQENELQFPDVYSGEISILPDQQVQYYKQFTSSPSTVVHGTKIGISVKDSLPQHGNLADEPQKKILERY